MKRDTVRLSKLRQTSQAAFAASSFSSWFNAKCGYVVDSSTEVRPGAVGHEGVGVECLHGQVAQPAGARLLLLAAEINKYF